MRGLFKSAAKGAFQAMPPVRRLLARIQALEVDNGQLAAQLASSQAEVTAAAIEAAARRQAEADFRHEFGDTRPFVPNGHFYSPIHSPSELQRDALRIFPASMPSTVIGIELREADQLQLLEQLSGFCRDVPFGPAPHGVFRYGFDNSAFGPTDALALHGMLRLHRPKRIIEVGSGYSSCMVLDTREHWLGGDLDCTFIEPYPDLLLSLLKSGDIDAIRVIPTRVQDVDLSVFKDLQAGDVLFIDSTHVSKVGSDVNRLFFDVLPSLASGTLIHIHDIFYPFEYPRSWLEEGRAWNELYLLRAMLQDSSAYEVLLFNNFMTARHREAFLRAMPLARTNPGGSIWLRKR